MPRGFDESYNEMQKSIDSSDLRLFLKSTLDMTYGYREFVPIDQIGVYGNTQATVMRPYTNKNKNVLSLSC